MGAVALWLPSLWIAAAPPITLDAREIFAAPGFAFIPYHNHYATGFQSGLQMILGGERVLDSGDLALVGPDGARLETRAERRRIDRAARAAVVEGIAPELERAYTLRVSTDGTQISIELALDRPIEWTRVSTAAFRIALDPTFVVGRSFRGERGGGVFPSDFERRELLRGTSKIRVGGEDPRRAFAIVRDDGPLELIDARRGDPRQWFEIWAPLERSASPPRLRIAIQPPRDPNARRRPVIGVSQIGYHPAQPKRAVVEVDGRERTFSTIEIRRIELAGEPRLIRSGRPRAFGSFLDRRYGVFDFSDVREPGLYVVRYGDERAGPFEIAADVYERAWIPTVASFLPIQMCHVAVRDGLRTWHGACHLDDAAQAPANHPHIAHYGQGARETRFADDEHIPGLDWGGWHDAGDFELAAGSMAQTTLVLALAEEAFHPDLDETTIARARREVRLHEPDGRRDLLQQVAFGAESLLALHRAIGHVPIGIVERRFDQFAHLGDASAITNNVRDGDDRWVFTNRNTAVQYRAAAALAASSRVLEHELPALAGESRRTALEIYAYERTHPPAYARGSYAPADDGHRRPEIAATAELFMTTGDPSYADALRSLRHDIASIPPDQLVPEPGIALARVLPRITDAELGDLVRAAFARWKEGVIIEASENPWRVYVPSSAAHPGTRLETAKDRDAFLWGWGWKMQLDAIAGYFLHRSLPQSFDAEIVFDALAFVLGAHADDGASWVSGVGTRSVRSAYGFNRADRSYVPGGIISGTSLVRPAFLELEPGPFLWYQKEYVINAAATYVFDVLAAGELSRARETRGMRR